MLYRPGLVGRLPCPQDWYFGSGPPTISDDFSSSLATGWTFTRASANATNCLYTDTVSAPAFTTYAANTPRFLDFGLLIEPVRTNLFLNSSAPVTQTITVAPGPLCVWVLGPAAAAVAVTEGTAFFIGAAGSATPGVPFFGTVINSGTMVFTCSGSPTVVQVEAGEAPTSYIPTTGVTQTRQDDRLNKNYFGGQLNAQQGTYWVEWMVPASGTMPLARSPLMTAGNAAYTSDNSTDQLYVQNATNNLVRGATFNASGVSGAVAQLIDPTLGRVSRSAMSVNGSSISIANDYTLGAAASSSYRPATLLAITLGGGGSGGSGGNHNPFNGFIRGFRYWPVAMPDAELKECTSPGYYSGPPVFDFSFMGGASAFPRRMLCTRANGTGVNTDSVSRDAPGSSYVAYPTANVPRMTAKGLLTDTTHSNFVPNSNAPVNSTTVNLSVQNWCLWMIGTGSVTVNANTAVGTGLGQTATQGNPVYFSITTVGTLNLVVTGSVNRAQIEQQGSVVGQEPKSFIQTTTSGQTSGGDIVNMSPAGWFNMEQCTYYHEVELIGYAALLIVTAHSGANDREQLFSFVPAGYSPPVQNIGFNTIVANGQAGRVDPPVPFVTSTPVIHKFAASRSLSGRIIALDGAVSNMAAVMQPITYPTNYTISQAHSGAAAGNHWTRRVRYYDYAMTAAQLIALTT